MMQPSHPRGTQPESRPWSVGRQVPRRVVAGSVALCLGIAGLLPVAVSTSAAAAPGDAVPVTITPNPSYQQEEFEGWGTSLVWFANATGGYPAEVRQDLFDKVFGDEGLRLNIARYNIGGGNATDVPAYLRAGGAVDGWWNPDIEVSDEDGPITTEYSDRDRLAAAWDADDPDSYDFDADETQRWWLTALEDRITKWEAFSNSPPYFMTESGFASGNFDAADEQLRPESVEDFATYLTTVVEHLEADTGIDFDSLDPFNEPNTNYWGTQLGDDGWPTGGRQEGAHIGPEAQDAVIKALAAQLADPSTTTDVPIAAMDETNPDTFVRNWNGWSAEAKELVDRLNVHTYSQGGSVAARDIAKTAGKPLWMSEVEGDWDGSGAGHNLTNIDNGIGMATHLTDDLRDLEPSAWVLWQPVEDKYNMEKVEKLNWGSVFIDFDCDDNGDSVRRLADGDADPSCGVTTNAKFNTLRNFTHYIEPGDHVIPSTDAETTAALKGDGSGVTLVHANPSTSARSVTVDLSKFETIAAGAVATPVVTTESPAADVEANALVRGAPVPVDVASKSVTLTLPAKSVSSLVISGVSGVADDAAPFVDGHRYQLLGAQSGKAAAAVAAIDSSPGATIAPRASDAATGAAQAWTAERLTAGTTNTERVALRSSTGALLAADSAGTRLTETTREQAASDPAVQWIPTTTDGSTWSLVNVATAQALEVSGQSTATGAAVGVYRSNGGTNQSWTFLDTALTGIQPVTASTIAGIPAALPSTVVPLYGTSSGAPVPVDWNVEGIDWNILGSVTVAGTGTDGWGTPFAVTASVDIGGFTATDPVSLTVAVGTSATTVVDAAPGTVPAQVGASTNRFDAPVEWDFSTLTDASLAAPGVQTVAGLAASNDPSAGALPATLSVIVTAASERNIAPDATTTATATSTESGYPVDRTRNGVVGDKGWSNWRAENKPAGDTLSYDLGDAQTIERVSVVAYKDGSTTSWPTELTAQWLDAEGTWRDAPGSPTVVPVPTDGTAPTVDIDLGGVTTSQVRVVMTAYANTHLVISEVEIYALVPSPSSEARLAALRVNGEAVEGFTGDDLEYDVDVFGSAEPVVDAVAVDRNAQVAVTRPSPEDVLITVTAEDGMTVSVTTLRIGRLAAVTATLPAQLREGVPATVSVTVDPVDSAVDYQWQRDSEPIDGADGVSYTPVPDDVGRMLSVSVEATADGFATARVVSNSVQVLAAPQGETPGGGTDDPNGTGNLPGSPGGSDAGSPPSVSDPGSDELSATGSDPTAGPLVVGALAIMILGLLLRIAGRRSGIGDSRERAGERRA